MLSDIKHKKTEEKNKKNEIVRNVEFKFEYEGEIKPKKAPRE